MSQSREGLWDAVRATEGRWGKRSLLDASELLLKARADRLAN